MLNYVIRVSVYSETARDYLKVQDIYVPSVASREDAYKSAAVAYVAKGGSLRGVLLSVISAA